MQAVRTSETSVNINLTTRRYIPEYSKRQPIHGLFNNASDSSDCTMLNDRMIKEMWKEVVITKFKVLSWNLPGETDKKNSQ
jgi:hypothetical protein